MDALENGGASAASVYTQQRFVHNAFSCATVLQGRSFFTVFLMIGVGENVHFMAKRIFSRSRGVIVEYSKMLAALR